VRFKKTRDPCRHIAAVPMPEVPNDVKHAVVEAVIRIDHFMRVELLTTLTDGRPSLEPQRDWHICVAACQIIEGLKLYFTDEQNQIADELIQQISSNLNSIADFVRELARLPRPFANEAELLEKMNQLLKVVQDEARSLGRQLIRSFDMDSNASAHLRFATLNPLAVSVDIFISYSTKDAAIAELLASQIRQRNFSVFLAHQTIDIGPRWETQVIDALRSCRLAILILSPQSLSSDWVRYEIGALWALGKLVAPALYGVLSSQLPDLLRQYQARSISESGAVHDFCVEVLTMLKRK
jgi:hypothetical protein